MYYCHPRGHHITYVGAACHLLCRLSSFLGPFLRSYPCRLQSLICLCTLCLTLRCKQRTTNRQGALEGGPGMQLRRLLYVE